MNPYAPPRADAEATPGQAATHRGSPARHGMNTDATCGSCGAALAAQDVLYSPRGDVICQTCLSATQVEESMGRSAAMVKGVAYTNLPLGLLAFIFNPFWILTAGAIANGVYVLRTIGAPDTARRLAGSLGTIKATAVAGMVLGVLAGILGLLSLFPR